LLRENSIVITPDQVVIPDGFTLGLEEKGILEVLRDRLRNPDQYESSVGDNSSTEG
jgi:hypothetical protein